MAIHQSTGSNRPLVSVITPAFNAIRYLETAINSVLAQSLQDWELIIVNDGSTDGTAEFLNSIQHPRVLCLHQSNAGVSSARNAGMAASTGKFITFLDADDCLPVRSLEVRSEFLLQNPDVDLVDGQVVSMDGGLEVELNRYKPYYRGRLLPRLLRLDSGVFLGVCYMFRRSILSDTQFPQQMSHVEDLAFYMLLADRSNIVYGHVAEEVYRYRKCPGSAMSDLTGLERGYLELIRLVKTLENSDWLDLLNLRVRISKIMLLSWGAAGHWVRGLESFRKVLGA